jgi:hypothetical protein
MKMQTFRKPHQWLNFWLEKYADTLSGLKYTGEQRKKYWATLKVFLEELPGNPRNIPLEKIGDFIEVNPVERLVPVLLFYKHIAPSKPHIELLRKLEARFDSTPSEHASDPVEKFKSELSGQQFSPRTVKNYTGAFASYVKWLEGDSPESASGRLDEYSDYLARIKKLSPRTVALHLSAIKLYYKQAAASSDD